MQFQKFIYAAIFLIHLFSFPSIGTCSDAEPDPAHLPDLVVTSVRNLTDARYSLPYELGIPMVFEITVRNLNYQENDVLRHVPIELHFNNISCGYSVVDLRQEATFRAEINTADIPIGSHSLTVIADRDSAIQESNEGNNELSFDTPITIQIPESPRPPRPEELWDHLPDLVVTDIRNVTSHPPPYEIGMVLEFDITVRNQTYQAGDILRNVSLSFTAGPYDVGIRYTIADLGQEATTHVVMNTGIGGYRLGEKTISATVDRDNVIHETDDENNQYSLAESIELLPNSTPAGALAELQIEEITTDPAQPQRGDRVIPVIRLRNSGNARSSLFYVNVSDSTRIGGINPDGSIQQREWNYTVENLEAGESMNLRRDNAFVMAKGGRQTFGVSVDIYRSTAESDENNNHREYTFETVRAEARPDRFTNDLHISLVEMLPENVVRGGRYEINSGSQTQFRVSVRDNDFSDNVDQLQVIENVEVLLGSDNDYSQRQTIRVEEGRGSATFTIRAADLGLDVHPLNVSVDPDNRVVESNENNNAYPNAPSILVLEQGAVQPRPSPDIAVGEIHTDPAQPRRGDNFIVVAAIQNLGTRRTGPFMVRLSEVAERSESLNTIQNIEPGESVEIRYDHHPLLARGGSHSIGIFADPFLMITEADEMNNSRRYDYAIEEQPVLLERRTKDLLIRWMTRAPRYEYGIVDGRYEANLADEIILQAEILDNDFINDSTEQPIENVEVLLQADNGWSQTQNVTIRNGRLTLELRIPAEALGLDVHRLTLTLDPANQIAESNENNNSYNGMVPVLILESGASPRFLMPDLDVEGARVDPEHPLIGQSLDMLITFRNAGSGPSGDFTAHFIDRSAIAGINPDGTIRFLEGQQTIRGLAAGESREERINSFPSPPASAGQKQISIRLDSDRQIVESDENNNYFGLSYEATAESSAPEEDPSPRRIVQPLRKSSKDHTPWGRLPLENKPKKGMLVKIKAPEIDGPLTEGDRVIDGTCTQNNAGGKIIIYINEKRIPENPLVSGESFRVKLRHALEAGQKVMAALDMGPKVLAEQREIAGRPIIVKKNPDKIEKAPVKAKEGFDPKWVSKKEAGAFEKTDPESLPAKLKKT